MKLLRLSLFALLTMGIWPRPSIAQTEQVTSFLSAMTFWKSHKALKVILRDRTNIFTLFAGHILSEQESSDLFSVYDLSGDDVLDKAEQIFWMTSLLSWANPTRQLGQFAGEVDVAMMSFLRRMDADFDGEVTDSEWDQFWVAESESEGNSIDDQDFRVLHSEEEEEIKVAENENEQEFESSDPPQGEPDPLITQEPIDEESASEILQERAWESLPVGVLSKTVDASPFLQVVVKSVLGSFNRTMQTDFQFLTAVSARSMRLSETSAALIIKVTHEADCYHLRVDAPGMVLRGVISGKTIGDPIMFFVV